MQFVPFITFIDPLFWDELGQRKLNVWKLDDNPHQITATYCNHDPQTASTRLSFSYEAFSKNTEWNRFVVPVKGSVIAVNTLEAFKNLNRKQILIDAAEKVKKCIESQKWVIDPLSLNTFCFTVYPDLKNYTFSYWNSVPALLYPELVELVSGPELLPTYLANLLSNIIGLQHHQPFLLIGNKPAPLSEILSTTLVWGNDTYVVYADPSTRQSFPGWPLRNLLAAIAYSRKDLHHAKFICYRVGSIPSIILHVCWRTDGDLSTVAAAGEKMDGGLDSGFINLRNIFDPLKLMEHNSELNLRLIRWRLVPNINLNSFTSANCLILGAGTLGCNVARALLGWGVKNFTFVDYAPLSYSNVVRQSLYNFDDIGHGTEKKAIKAAENLRKINPLINAEGVVLKIPMPGHIVSKSEVELVKEVVNQLEDLILRHNVIFLLLDSREARWLPTLLSSLHHKLAISVALGFDSFVVIRHGITDAEEDSCEWKKWDSEYSCDDPNLVPGSELGCYFCSDVTAPGNSSVDRTLDQQCTVSRAGVSFAASGSAVELFAALMQHPCLGRSPARLGENDESTTALGATPHQIRSFLSRFTQMTPAVRRFERCTACGTAVRDAYISEGFDFLLKVFNDPKYLELVSGLDQLHAAATQMDLWEFDENESIIST